MPKFSWREFVVDKLLSLRPEELHRIGTELRLIHAGEPYPRTPGELGTLLLHRAAADQKEEMLVPAVYRTLGRWVARVAITVSQAGSGKYHMMVLAQGVEPFLRVRCSAS